jgi:hypothetical protein
VLVLLGLGCSVLEINMDAEPEKVVHAKVRSADDGATVSW